MNSADEKKWMMDEQDLVASGLVGEDIFIEFRLKLDEPNPHHDHHRFILYRDDQPIPSHRYNVQTRGNIIQLTLKQSQQSDTGHYALVAKKLSTNNYSLDDCDNKEIVRKKIRMSVRTSSDNFEEDEPPVFVRRLTDLSVKVGTRTRFLVEIRSSSNPKVTWHKNDLPVQSGSRFSFVHEGNFYCVDVAPVMVEDQGHWTCMVENINGRSSCTSCLSVIVPKAYKPPEFVEELRALLTETGTVSLECKVVGVPAPVLRWFKDEKEIKAGDVFALTANVDDPTSLGTYACQAVNCMGTSCSSSRVHVMGRGSREGSLKPADTLLPAGPIPVFKKILKDESCRIGDNITLSCQVQVPPWPKVITWYNKEGRVEPDEKYHLMEDGLGTYSIEVRGVEAMDEGEWKCVATSAENVIQFTTCFVAMSIPKNYRIPRFMESLKAVLTEEGLVSFECKVVGFPTPLLRWFKDGQELKPGDVYQLTGTNSLGSYCCIAKNCMGESKSTAELTVEDIQNQLNEEERLQLLSTDTVPKFIKGLRSCEARIHEDFTFTIQVSISPAPTLSWYRDDEPIVENEKYKMIREVLGACHLEIHKLEFIDQAEWKCVAANDFGHSITSCFLKLIIPRHFKKPKFLESLRAILSEEGAVNLECKVIGVPQPILKWYKDGVELKPGDIHRIISGQDGTCCLGIYTCEATNCMGSVSSSASLLGFDDRVGVRNEESKEPISPLPHELARNLSLSTIHEERTSQLYDTPQTDHSITIDDRGEVSFSFDGKEVSVSLYETPDLTEEEAIQIVEMYADQLSEHITEGNIIELPPMRFMKETSTTGNLLMEAVVIDFSPDYFVGNEEADDLRTEADFDDVSIMDDQMQSILSSYSAPAGEQSGERTPMGSPPPRPPRRKERSDSASSKSEKSDKSQPKCFDWSESYHSAKEPSMHAQLSLQSQDSFDAFADALSSEGLMKTSPEDRVVKAVSNAEERMDIDDDIHDTLDIHPVTLLQSAELIEEVFAVKSTQSMGTKSSGERKRKKKLSKDGTPMLSSKTSSEESYTMGIDDHEPEEKIQRRRSKNSKEKRERRDSNSSNKSNKSTKGGKEKKKRKSHESEHSLRIEEIKFEKMVEPMLSHISNQADIDHGKERDDLLEERPASTASSVFTTAGEISDKSSSKSQKERLFENIKILANPVIILRNTLIDLDNILMTYSENKLDDETVQALILERIVRPVENLCEQMSVIEMKAVQSAGDRSLMQDIRISLLDAIGGPTEELLRGIELIRSHENKTSEDFQSDLIVLESLTDPVDEILSGLAKIEYELKCKEGIADHIEFTEHPIILERMTRAISQLGDSISDFVQENQTIILDSQITTVRQRLESIYQNLDSFVKTLPLHKITGTLESNVDTLVIETLVKPVERLVRIFTFNPSIGILEKDETSINRFQKAVLEMKTKLDTLTIALETYEMESGEHGVTEKNLQLVNFLKWMMDDLSDKLIKIKDSKKNDVLEVSDDIQKSSPTSSDEEWKEYNSKPDGNFRTDKIETEIIDEMIHESTHNVNKTKLIEDETNKVQKPIQPETLIKFPTMLDEQESNKVCVEDMSETVTEIKPTSAILKRAKYKSRLTSLDSATVELDETLSLPEMLLDPLIDVQAKLNSALHHYEYQNPTDASSSPTTELTNCLIELRESTASAAHVATTLNITDTLNSIIDLREPLLDFQLALSSTPTSQEMILLEEVIRPLNELKELISATIRSSSVSESSQVILKQVIRMIDEIHEKLPTMSEQKVSLETPNEAEIKMVTTIPPEEIEHASLTLSSVHFALSTALAKANDYSMDEPSKDMSVSDQTNVTPAQRLIISVENLRHCVGDVAVSIASLIVPEGSTPEYAFHVASDELMKLQEPLLNLQKILLTEKHQPEERHVLNDIANPLRTLREAILEISEGQSSVILELLEDVEKDVSLIAMEALKKSLEEKIIQEESSVCDLTPGEVPRIVSKWLDPIENWLTSASSEIDEKERIKSVVIPVVDDLKRRVLKIAIQSAYSEPPSDIALIEEIVDLKKPLHKVYEVISTQHNPADLEVIESLIQPTKHLLGTILDTSLIHHASSILRPVLEVLEELENQIPLSIKTITYERTLQRVVKSMASEEFHDDENIEDLEELDNIETLPESAIVEKIIEEKHEVVKLDETASPQIKIDVHDIPNNVPLNIIQHNESILMNEENVNVPELPQGVSDNVANDGITNDTILNKKKIDSEEELKETPSNNNAIVDEKMLMRSQSQISLATARTDELDLWTLTILGPLERLANTTLALDRSIDEDVHAHLCRPLDSLHKQIELVESQINCPPGQSLGNDVETIIEGFLSPINQVATALKIAVDIWHKIPAKQTVRIHLQELNESCSDLCERLKSLKQKLIVEAPVQTLQVQKAEASVVETITAVLGPLEGIQEIIIDILNKNVEKKDDDYLTTITQAQGEHESDDIILKSEGDNQNKEVSEKFALTESHESESKHAVEHIEKTTARPLQELIEAIVDPDSVRYTSTTPEGMENTKSVAERGEPREKIPEKAVHAEEDEMKICSTLDDEKKCDEIEVATTETMVMGESGLINEKLLKSVTTHSKDQKTELIHTQELSCVVEAGKTMSKEEAVDLSVQDSQEFNDAIADDVISNSEAGELQKNNYPHVEISNLANATLHQVQQKILQPASMSETHSVEESIRKLIVEEVHKQNIETSVRENLMSIVENKLHAIILDQPTVSQNAILETIIHDIIQDVHQTDDTIIDDSSMFKVDEVKNETLQSASSSEDLDRTKEKNSHINEKETISADNTIYINCIRDIARSELDRQNALSCESEILMDNIEKSVLKKMIECPQICQENVFEESVRDIVEEELQKSKNMSSAADEIVAIRKDKKMEASIPIEISQEKMEELIQDELYHMKDIEPTSHKNLIQTVKTKLQDMILICPPIVQDDFLKKNIREMIVQEISQCKLEQVTEDGLVEVDEIVPEMVSGPSTVKITSLDIAEEKIQNMVLDQLQKQEISTLESDQFTIIVMEKIQKILLTCPEKLQDSNIAEIVRDIMTEELIAANKVLKVEDVNITEECTPDIQVKMDESIVLSSEDCFSTDRVQCLVQDELQKQHIQSVDIVSVVKSVQAKLEQTAASFPHVLEQNILEGYMRDIITEKLQEQVSEMNNKEGLRSDADNIVKYSSAQRDDNHANNMLEISKKANEYSVEEPEPESFNVASVQIGGIVDINAIPATDLKLDKMAEMKLLEPQYIFDEITSEKHIQELVAKEMIKQNAQLTADDKFVSLVTSKIQEIIANNPDVHDENSLEVAVHDMIVENLLEKETKSLEAEFLNESEKLKLASSNIAEQSQDEISEEVLHSMIVEELHKQNIQATKEENFINNIASKVYNLMAELPEIPSRCVIENNLQDIVTELLEEQKIEVRNTESLVTKNKPKAMEICEISSTNKTGVPDIVHKLIIEEFDKHNILPSEQAILSKRVESEIEELINSVPEDYKCTTLEKNIQNIVEETLKDQKLQTHEIQELSKVSEAEIIAKEMPEPSVIQGQTSPLPDEIVHELIIDELHKQNIQVAEEGNIMKTIQTDIQMLIIQHPEITELDALEESIQDIVTKALTKEKVKLIKTKEMFTAEAQGTTVQEVKVPSVDQIENPLVEIIQGIILEDEHIQNIESSKENSFTNSADEKVQELAPQSLEISKCSAPEESMKDAVSCNLKKQKTDDIDMEDQTMSKEIVMETKQPDLSATLQIQPPLPEVVHLLIVEELHEQNVQLSKESNLIREIETKIQEMIAKERELYNLEALEDRIHYVVADILKQKTEKVEDIESFDAKEEIREAADIKIQSSVQSKALPKEFIQPLIVEELHKHNIQTSKEADLVKAIVIQVQSLIAPTLEMREEVLSEKIRDFVIDIMNESTVEGEKAVKFDEAEKKKASIIDSVVVSATQTKIEHPNEMIRSLIIEELHHQNVQPSETTNLIEAVEIKMGNLIIQNPKEYQTGNLGEIVHSTVAEVMEEQRAQSIIIEELATAEKEEVQVENTYITPTIKTETIAEEFIRPLIIEELHKQTIQLPVEADFVQLIEAQVQSFITVNPDMCQPERLSGKIHDVVADLLEKHKILDVNKISTLGVEEIPVENIKTSSVVHMQELSEEVVHDLIIDELHKQNGKQLEEANLVRAIETKLQRLIAACPEVSKEHTIEEKVQDIVTEVLEKQNALPITTEELQYAEKQNVQIEDIREIITTDEIEIPNYVHEMILREFHERDIEPSVKQNLVESINAQVLQLVQRHLETPKILITKENIQDIFSEELLKENVAIHTIEVPDKVCLSEESTESARISSKREPVSEDIIRELINEEISKQDIQLPKDGDFVETVQSQVRTLIDECFEISNAYRLEEIIHEVVAEKLMVQKTKVDTSDDDARAQEALLHKTDMNSSSEMSDEIVGKLIIEELGKQNVPVDTNLLEEIETKIQDLVTQNLEPSNRGFLETNVEAITKSVLKEREERKHKEEENTKMKIKRKEIRNSIISTTAQSDIPEEIVHELIIDQLHKQNVQPIDLSESNLVKAIEMRVHDLIAQHPEISQEHIVEESVHEIVTENLEKQKANIFETEQLAEANHQKSKIKILNLPSPTEIQIPDEIVHDMIIDALHKHDIGSPTEESLVVAIETRIHDLIANHPEMCSDDIIEESIHDIITEVQIEQKANVLDTENLSKAKQQIVKVEISPPTNDSQIVDSKEVIDDQADVNRVELLEDESHAKSPEIMDQDNNGKGLRTSRRNKSSKVDEQNQKTDKSRKATPTIIEKRKTESSEDNCMQVTNDVMTQDLETSLSNVKHEEKDDKKNKQQQNNIQPQTNVNDQLERKQKIEKEFGIKEMSSKKVPEIVSHVNTDSELESEFSECSKSTLKDISHLDKQKQSVPPMIEIDYDISSAKEMFSHQSSASTKRLRDQRSFDFEEKSMDIYSSTTNRVHSSSHGPRDRGKKPTFCTKLTDRTAAESSRIKLTCTVLGDPEPQVYWTKDEKQLPSSSNRHCTTMDNGLASLEIYAVTPKDSGEYSCIATNIHGHSCTEAKLKVYAGYEPTPTHPTFTRSIKDTYRPDENALILECRVRGKPTPTITWLKDGQILQILDRHQQSDLADGICRLKIFNPDFYDSGLYTCRAENDTRLSDRTSQLINFEATGKQRKLPSWGGSNSCIDLTSTHKDTGKPRFSSYLTDHNVPAGGTIALQVEVKGVPPPEITWMRTDKKGPISVPKARTFADSGVYTLIVPDATEYETGTYVCRASNAYGHVDTTANVEVVSGCAHDGGKPAIFVSRPPDKHVIVAVGEDVSVSFRTTGVPKPRVFWLKGLRDITSGPRSYKESHDDYVRLTLKRACPSDEGTYCILVKNRYGCDRSFFTVQVRQRARSLTPSPEWGPLDTDNLLANIHDKERSYLKQVPGPISSEPVVTDGGRNWLALTWGKAEQRGPAPVVAYRVDAWLLGGEGGARWAELGVTPINAFDAFNLRPGEDYKFRITPRNRYGWGEPVTMTNSVTVREIVKFPEFTKILSGRLKALAGTILNLEAEVTSDSMAQIKWYRDTTEIDNGQDSRFTTYFNGSKCSLMIGNISENDSGRYVCEATNAAGRVSTFARVQVVEDIKIVEADLKLRTMRSSEIMNEERPPEFTMRLRDRRVQATYPVRLTCQVTGCPEPEVTWYKYREEIYSHDNVAIWNDEAHFHTLEISRSTIDDSGIYMARAKNAYGSVTCRCHLVVDKGIRAYIAPEFLGHLDSFYTVKAGSELRMTAQVEAYPTVGITWHRDGHRLRPSRDVIMTLNHDGTVELALAHVTLRDAGLYCCTANNEVGQAESSTRVTVLETNDTKNSNQSMPEVIETSDIPYSKAPLFVTKPLSTEAFEGDTVIILCEVVGDPKPEVIWLRDFLRPDYYKDAPHFRRIGAGPQYRLEIPYAKFDFTGTYSIIAKNCHGEAKAVISLQIYARGQGKEDSGMESTIKHGNVQTLPAITRPLRDLRCCDGDAITLVCKIRATPEPDVRWEKGGKLVPLGDDFAADFDGETARLSIQHVYPEDEGEYTCVVYNDLGKAYTSACLIVDVPEGKETALSRRLAKPPGFLSANSTPISTPRSTPVRSLSPSCASRRELKPITKIPRGAISGRRPKMPTGPKFYAVPHNRVAEEGETVRFQCAVAGHPAPWVTWDKDGISVMPSVRISLKEKDDVRILEITEITHEDAGLYRITLENDVGRTEATARLEIIRGRQNSVSRSIDTRSASPKTYSIYGRSHLSPSPRPDARLQPPRLNDTYSDRGGTISPTHPRWHQRNGKQPVQTDSKKMKNGNTATKSSSKIVRSSSIPRRTSSQKNFESKNLPESPKFKKMVKTQTIQCITVSEIPSTAPARIGTNGNLKLPKKRSSTLITPTNTSNNSTTITTANNVFLTNSEAKKEGHLTMNTRSPIISAAPADVIALRGAKVTLLATYDGSPKPTVKWLRKGHDMALDDKAEIETGAGVTCLTLINVTADESGKYEVRIENAVGSDSKYVNVTVEGPPEPPADKPTVHSVVPTGSITLTWRTPVYDGGCAVTGYTVEMRRGDEPCWITVAEATHSLTHTVQQLDAMESYQFRVRAENVHGLSEPGMESDVITIPSGPTSDESSEKLFGIKMDNESESEEEFEPAFEARIVSTESGQLFNERYDVHEELGKGRYGVVRRIIEKATGLNLAAKFIRTIKSKDRQQVHDEINIMNMLRHPKLLRLAAAFENPKEMIMVTEYISGGELFERVVADDFTLTEKDSILFVRQICQGVEYMHNNKVVHLDLKPENIMCHTRTSHRIKLIDFGLAQTLKPDTPIRVLFGTPEFIPPEIIGFEPIGTESDMWSVGVICYVLLSGLSPFMGENDAETFANITRADHDFDDKAFHAISQEAQDFISALLVKRKELRMSATDCLKHPWLAQRDESMSRVVLPTDKLKKFIVRRKWQKTGNAIRALGRMATLSANSRKNISSSPPLSKPFEKDIDRTKFSDSINEEPFVEYIDNFIHPTPENSPEDAKNISFINKFNNNGIEIEEIDESQTSINLSLGEMSEEDLNDLDNVESLTMIDTSRSYGFDEDTKIKNDENIFIYNEANSATNENIEDEPSTAECTSEIPMTSDDISSENDTMFTAFDSTINDNTVTIDISPKSLQAITEERKNNTSSFCTFKNLHINEPNNESTEPVTNTVGVIEEQKREITTLSIDSLSNNKKEKLSNTSQDIVAPTRPNFIAIKNHSNPIDCSPKPWNKTNPSSLDAEGEIARIKKSSPLHRVVRTGSVSRTAKMFEQEELSSPIKHPTSPGSRIVIPTSDARPQNERIRKAFAFWNK
ncbi:hypothetical protein PV328_001733 [Microctonus aethiopoides]|uniref:Titin n=1 Tax=Microctonus aethiopoides TaxID=144406 RepID=A0AA39FXU1_9HYME|nr:hypothetical protein PV328_001733 [Microctonus aethiopoides]